MNILKTESDYSKIIRASGIDRFYPIFNFLLWSIIPVIIIKLLINDFQPINVMICVLIIIYLISYLIKVVSDIFLRRIIITETEIIDRWGVFRKSISYQKAAITDGKLLFDLDNNFRKFNTLKIYGSKHEQIGEIDLDYFNIRDQELLVELICNSTIDKIDKEKTISFVK